MKASIAAAIVPVIIFQKPRRLERETVMERSAAANVVSPRFVFAGSPSALEALERVPNIDAPIMLHSPSSRPSLMIALVLLLMKRSWLYVKSSMRSGTLRYWISYGKSRTSH